MVQPKVKAAVAVAGDNIKTVIPRLSRDPDPAIRRDDRTQGSCCLLTVAIFVLFTLLINPAHAQTQYKLVHFSTGTGFFINNNGDILTNAHVVKECDSAEVTGAGVHGTAEILMKDMEHDVALLNVQATPSAAAVFRSGSIPMHEGDEVVVVGHPLGQGLTTSAAEYISNSGPTGEPGWLRFSSSVFQGNSGGPLLDGNGQVIGMIMAKTTTYRYANSSSQGEAIANADVAIQPFVLEELLNQRGIWFRYGENDAVYEPHRVEDVAREFVVQIKCRID